jgi:hypothetical protein
VRQRRWTTERRWTTGLVAVAVATAVVATGPEVSAAPARPAAAPAVSVAPDDTALVRLRLPDRAFLDRLVAQGADLAGRPRAEGSAVLADLVVTGRELAALRAAGAVPTQLIQRAGAAPRPAATARTLAADTLVFLQSYVWTSTGQTFVQAEVATTAVADPDVEITVTWQTADGRTGSFPLVRFEDAGEYQYHYALPQPVPAAPVRLTATSSLGGTAARAPQRWPGPAAPPTPAGYQRDFIDAYLTPTDIQARIARIKRQYRGLVDVIDLPNKTQGYRRTATAYLGDPATAAVVVESVKFGDQGWNGVQVKTVAGPALAAVYRDRVLTVTIVPGTTTTDQVAALIAARFPNRFAASVETGSAGLPMPVTGPVPLSDGLDAPAGVSRKPWTVQALRIGYHRDGSRVGVLAYSQEHAREWATPLVTLEFAERLLANARTDAETKALLENVDVFVIPTVNPDGANYSFNDYNFQRKNLVNHCTGAARDPRNADRWGVDVNRNYTVGSVFDGYVGASTNCLSDVYAGTGELSEPESRNVIALADAHPNIRFAMNVHSYGGYFMWPPGSYTVPGRITLPRPPVEEQAEFLASAKRIVGAIAADRGTVTWPSNTGPVADVLYSAAGNSADQLYYEKGIFAWDFEVGTDRWNPATQEWEGVGFQPPYEEAHAESQEYAGGLVELLRVARDYAATHPTT